MSRLLQIARLLADGEMTRGQITKTLLGEAKKRNDATIQRTLLRHSVPRDPMPVLFAAEFYTGNGASKLHSTKNPARWRLTADGKKWLKKQKEES